MPVLIDTNILLRIAEPTHEWHQLALQATDHLRAAGHELVIVPQNLYELWVVATRTPAGNGLGKRFQKQSI